MEKTSLEKSHSKVSNFKLTLICLLGIIAFALIFIGLGLFKKYQTYSIYFLAIGGVLELLSLILINKFVR